ncbi:MAG: hypothetical protein HQK76_16390, partial [Desulfobacterales bacterium]|nr:hypothetical protein [Desulfobacterales bacterium]
YTRIFTVLVGNTSKSRKGTSATLINRIFEKIPDTAIVKNSAISSGEITEKITTALFQTFK